MIPPWSSIFFDNPTKHLTDDATEWYEEAYFRLVDGSTMVVLAIQGPGPISERFNVEALLDSMTERVRADPPSTLWKKE